MVPVVSTTWPPAADRRQCKGQRDHEAAQQDDQLHGVDPGRRQQAASGEVDGDDDAANDAAGPQIETGDGAQHPRHADELPGEDRQRRNPEQHGDGHAHRLTVAMLEEVAHGAEVVLRRKAPHRGSDPDRQHDGPDASRADPPPHAQPVSICQPRGADRRSAPDVGREERREEQHRAEPAAGDEEVGRTPHPPPDPQSDAHEHRGVDQEDDEVQVHLGRSDGGPARDDTRVRGCSTRGPHDPRGRRLHDGGPDR